MKKGRWVVNVDSSLKGKVLWYINPMAAHIGYHRTYQMAKMDFIWKRINGDIKNLVRECNVCQANKYETFPPMGFL